MRKLHY